MPFVEVQREKRLVDTRSFRSAMIDRQYVSIRSSDRLYHERQTFSFQCTPVEVPIEGYVIEIAIA